MVEPLEQHNNLTRLRSSVAERFSFQFILPFERAVFPIFQRHSDGTSLLAGTGFFIAPLGIFVSAAHVFEIQTSGHDSFWTIYIDSMDAEHELEINEVKIRPENRDIALGQISIDMIEHPMVSIMELLPEVNEVVASFAFSHTIVHEAEGQGSDMFQRIQYRSHWEVGIVEEVNQTGLLHVPGPAFSSSILVEGRASGGPVFNSNGFVVGVNCRGMAPIDSAPYSIAKSLQGIRELEFDGIPIGRRRQGIPNLPIATMNRISSMN